MTTLRTRDPYAQLAGLVPYIYDPKVGLVNSIAEHQKESGSPEFFRYIAGGSNTKAFTAQENFSIGGGASTHRPAALAKAIGETIERYCAAIYDRFELPFHARREAPFRCVEPGDFALFAPAQYADPEFVFEPFTDESEMRWTPMTSLVSGDEIHVPACFVYVPYVFYRSEEEWPLAQSISTGLSCHVTLTLAAMGGLCEVIERDCFTLTWQAMMSCPRIRIDSLSDANRGIAARFERVGYQLQLVDITNDSRVPTVLAVIRNPVKGAVPLSVAASTELDPEVAVRKALEELAHTERYMYQIMREVDRLPEEAGHGNVVSQVSHVNYWCSPERTRHADFLTASPLEKDFADMPDASTGDPESDLATLVRHVRATGHDVLLKDITTEDITTLGLHVVRVVVPGYHPLFMGYQGRALGGRRLWEVPQRLGYRGITPSTGDNPFPHPFP